MVNYKKWGGLIAAALVLTFIFQGMVFAATYAANAGHKTSVIVNDNAGAPLAVDKQLHFFHLTTSRIVGPNSTGAAADPVAEVLRPHPLVTPNGRVVGYDSVDGSYPPPASAGKFWHQANDDASGPINFFVRAWDGDPAAAGSRFGESNIFTSNTNPAMPPSPNSLGVFATIFPKAVPADPTFNAATVVRGGSSRNPSVTVNINAKLGTRYVVYSFRNPDGTEKQNSGNQYYNSQGYAVPVAGANMSWSPTLARTDDNRTYSCRVTAWNSFGQSSTVTQSIFVPENGDDTNPFPVTDIRVATWDAGTRRLSLVWIAPYDTNKYGAATAVNHYVFKVASVPLVDAPVTPLSSTYTNPFQISNWNDAIAITPEGVVTPRAFRTSDEATFVIPAGLGGTFFVAMKSYDAVGEDPATSNGSNISNVIGVGGAGGGSFAFDLIASATDKLVVNSITVPSGMTMKAADLISLINTKAGSNIVIVLGKWDPATGKAAGLKPDGEGTNFDVVPGIGYQVYVNHDYRLVLP